MAEREVTRFVDGLLAESDPIEDPNRANELRTDLEKQTLALARLLDHGYKVDLRAQQLAPAEDTPESEEAAALREAIEHVIAAREHLRTIKLTGRPILGLPESVEDEADSRDDEDTDADSSAS